MNAREAVPLLLLAGGLGAGKTTLLARWVAEPAFANTAVLVNEPGEAAIDAHLVGGGAGGTHTLEGCACCAGRARLAAALDGLDGQRRRGGPAIERAIVELAGFAHPAPVLAELASDALVRERFPLHGVATLVDASQGAHAIEGAETRAQVAAADVLVLAKTDAATQAEVARLCAEMARLNPDADIVRANHRSLDAMAVWDAAGASPGRDLRLIDAALEVGDDESAPPHDAGLRVHTLPMRHPVELSGFCVRLAAFLEAHRDRVLRVKGLVPVQGRKGPGVIQAVRDALQPVRTLKEWPAGATSGALVIVARGLDDSAVRSALP